MYINWIKITIFAIYTPWETLEKFRFTLPHFPLLLRLIKTPNIHRFGETHRRPNSPLDPRAYLRGVVDIFSSGVEIFSGGVEKFLGGVEKFSWGFEKFSGGLRNFWGGVEKFSGGGVEKFSRGVEKFSGEG